MYLDKISSGHIFDYKTHCGVARIKILSETQNLGYIKVIHIEGPFKGYMTEYFSVHGLLDGDPETVYVGWCGIEPVNIIKKFEFV